MDKWNRQPRVLSACRAAGQIRLGARQTNRGYFMVLVPKNAGHCAIDIQYFKNVDRIPENKGRDVRPHPLFSGLSWSIRDIQYLLLVN
jgi:hypothetical protein